jgi:dienelactone hydrolase
MIVASRATPHKEKPMPTRTISRATRPLGLAAALLGTAVASAADFPPPDKLPRNPNLPDPLVFFDGKKVTTHKQWFDKRRPELKALFQHYMYGYTPPPPDKVSAKVTRTDRKALGGKATLKEVTLAFGGPKVPRLHVLLVVPNERKGPAPVFVGLNFRGNHTLLDDPKIALPTTWMPGRFPHVKNNRATDAGRGTRKDVWALDQSVARGYAVATCYCGDIDPDRPDFTDGVHPHYLKAGEKLGPHDWGTIAAWAWGLSRIVDYLVTDKDLDKDRIAVVGHSRLGKTALLAAAMDERIALAVPLQAGCGGTSPSRGKVGESVKRINTSFPHWFNDTFPLFNDQVERLPFDQNCLVALVAPRPVLFANATEDTWANPAGQFEVLRAADPVYRFLDAGGLDAKKMPPTGKLVDSTLGYYIRPGKHSMTRGDWKVFLDFADKNMPRK